MIIDEKKFILKIQSQYGMKNLINIQTILYESKLGETAGGIASSSAADMPPSNSNCSPHSSDGGLIDKNQAIKIIEEKFNKIDFIYAHTSGYYRRKLQRIISEIERMKAV